MRRIKILDKTNPIVKCISRRAWNSTDLIYSASEEELGWGNEFSMIETSIIPVLTDLWVFLGCWGKV